MSGFWFRLTRLPAEFGADWRHDSVYGLDLVPGNRRALWPSPWRSVRSIRIIPVTSITYGRDQILQGRKGPVFRRVSLRIGWKAPSLRDGSVTWHPGPAVAASLPATAWNSQRRRIGAAVRPPGAKAVASSARDPSESQRDIRYLPVALVILPIIPTFSS